MFVAVCVCFYFVLTEFIRFVNVVDRCIVAQRLFKYEIVIVCSCSVLK